MTTKPQTRRPIAPPPDLPHAQICYLSESLPLARGGSLPAVHVCYETWGRLGAAADNAVLVCHAMSGDSHAARHDAADADGWWDEMIGPGRPIDTDRFFVVCSNVLGGCRGTTGPGDVDPSTGHSPQPYGADFPTITIDDMVDVQRHLADHLGVDRWRAVVGGSLGGHQTLTWATRYPERVGTAVAIATSPRLSSQSLGFDVIARNAIATDPAFAGGQYYDQPRRPDTGLAIARMLGHITYLSVDAMEAKFDPDRHDPRRIAGSFEQRFSVGSYLAHQGQKFVTRFDANSYITLSMAMDLFDLGDNRLSLMETFDETTCDFLVISFSSDWLFTPGQSRSIVEALTALDKRVTYAEITTDAGHDAFLISRVVETFGPLVRQRLTSNPIAERPDEALSEIDRAMIDGVPAGASVLDLGCGDGRWLAAVQRRDGDRAGHLMGVEVAQDNILATATLGIDVIDYDLNGGLPAFIDDQFDFVVLNNTLQAVDNVVMLLDEMLRVGRAAIVRFPNFGHRSLRESFVQRGRCPRAPGIFDYDWFDTPNRRFPTIADVEDLLQSNGVAVLRRLFFERAGPVNADADPNLNADTAVFWIRRG